MMEDPEVTVTFVGSESGPRDNNKGILACSLSGFWCNLVVCGVFVQSQLPAACPQTTLDSIQLHGFPSMVLVSSTGCCRAHRRAEIN